MVTVIKTADDLLALLAECGGAIVRGGECGPCEVEYALRAGRGYVNAAGTPFIHRPPFVLKHRDRGTENTERAG